MEAPATFKAMLKDEAAPFLRQEWLRWKAASGIRNRLGALEGLWSERTYPIEGAVDRGGEPWWQVSDEVDPAGVAAHVIARLGDRGLPRLRHHLERDVLREHLARTGDTQGLALMLAVQGPGPELDEAIAALVAEADESPRRADYLHGFIAHVRERAGAAQPAPASAADADASRDRASTPVAVIAYARDAVVVMA